VIPTRPTYTSLQLFVASGLESKEFHAMEELSNGMGLFLQKTNIIRDYLEDIVEEPAPRYQSHPCM
jgi:farnesyl-diphosphate farnesyltransferase